MSTPDSSSVDKAVNTAISDAKTAALKAGVGLNRATASEEEEDLSSSIKVSLAFELEGLSNAPSLMVVEKP